MYKINNAWENCSIFGSISATPGMIYKWKIKVIKSTDGKLYIGIVQANKCKEYMNKPWWFSKYGYACYAGTGCLYHDRDIKIGCGNYGQGDVIDIVLDLKGRGGKNRLSFYRNNEKNSVVWKMNAYSLVDYKLAIGIFGRSKKIEILSCEIKNS